ncbi:PREDICTED: membrane-bound alkaline phosphatase-like [Rhagoletis zephyria]|uniref:membrane-bound alkaline phosphatase-like n=1 Tax=Rhagoletis zephyria TaxID=28612 RepID=UPI0008114B77|nr:PREDICTED: membrane-bound alkaline phosphatase-like [Rhagoletis zephyria]
MMHIRFLFALALTGLLMGVVAASDRAHPRSTGTSTRLGSASHLTNEAEREASYWIAKAQNTLSEKLQQSAKLNANGNAKNIIFFLGDGMSIHTVTAARNLMGDSANQVSFEKFPYFGLSKTYCVDRQVADSACTATAYLGGVKANYGTIGVNAKVKRHDCTTGQNPDNFVDSIAKWAQDAGKDTGLVTTARVTHASPGGMYAHTANRDWENDAAVFSKSGCSAKSNVDIARQLVEWNVGKNLKVVMGGGRRNFINTTVNDEEGLPGQRTDGRNLIQDWLKDKDTNNQQAAYVWSKKGLSLVDLDKTEYLLGLFANSHCPYNGDLERSNYKLVKPSLTEMTEAAIKVLQKNKNGYFLFVEGARIDMAHHDTRARKSLEDTVEFSRAIERAREMTSEEDTLIVVTSDHSHTMTINGYPYRDSAITGLSDSLGADGLPFTILSYANGPGFSSTYNEQTGRSEITAEQTENVRFEYPATVPLDSETHGGDDVGVFASGPFAQYFSGNYEQSNIPAMMARALNIGPYANI